MSPTKSTSRVSSWWMSHLLLLLKVSKSQNIFSWNSVAQKMNEILNKVLPYEAKEFVKYFVCFLSNGVSRKNICEIYWPLDSLINSFSNKFSLFQLEAKNSIYKKCWPYRYCNFVPFCVLIKSVLLVCEHQEVQPSKSF